KGDDLKVAAPLKDPDSTLPTGRCAFHGNRGVRGVGDTANEHATAIGGGHGDDRVGHHSLVAGRTDVGECQHVSIARDKLDLAGPASPFDRKTACSRPSVVGVIEVKAFLGSNQIAQVSLHAGHDSLVFRIGELRDGDSRQNPDDHNYDQKLD